MPMLPAISALEDCCPHKKAPLYIGRVDREFHDITQLAFDEHPPMLETQSRNIESGRTNSPLINFQETRPAWRRNG